MELIDKQILNEDQLKEIEIKYGFPFHTNPSFGLHVRRLIASNRKLIEERNELLEALKVCKVAIQKNLAYAMHKDEQALVEAFDVLAKIEGK